MTREDGFSLLELLVSIALLGIVAGGVTSVIISTQRAEQFQSQMQTVMDDARISMERIRKELREARRVLPDSCQDAGTACEPSAQLHFWVDQNQDNIQDAAELICYVTKETAPGSNQFRLYRFTNATTGCRATAALPANARVLAETLVGRDFGGVDDARPFTDLDPDPTAVATDDETRNVEVTLDLEVLTGRGPDEMTFTDRIRLRNVA